MPNSEAPQESPGDNRKPKKKSPLWYRLYYATHMVEIVRTIGYADLPLPEAQAKMRTLTEKYGRALIEEATDEIIEIDKSTDPPIARLTQAARKLACGILGFAPEAPTDLRMDFERERDNALERAAQANNSPRQSEIEVPSKSTTPDVPTRTPETPAKNGSKVKERRNKVLREYRKILADRKDAQVAENEGDGAFDFVVQRNGTVKLICVRRRITDPDRQGMRRWMDEHGDDCVAVQAWPVEDTSGWKWEEHVIYVEPCADEEPKQP